MQDIILFFRLFRWFSLRQMRNHLFHVIAVLFGIALGASVFTSVRLSVNASLSSFTQSVDMISGRTDYIIVTPGGRISENLVVPLVKHPAVKTASPVLSSYVRLSEKDEPFLLVGLDPILDRPLRAWRIIKSPGADTGLLWADLIKKPYSVLIGEGLVKAYGLKSGHDLSLEHARNRLNFEIIGKLSYEGLAMAEGGKIAITDIASFQELTGTRGLADRIDLLLRPSATTEDINSIRSILPEDAVLKQPSERKQTGRQMIKAYQLNLSVLSFVSLFVGMFLVYSLTALNAASRRREIAVMRSVGASSHLIFSIFVTEGAVLGLAGWMIAIPLSTLLVKYFLYGVSQTVSTLFVRIQSGQLHLSLWEIFLSFGITVFSATLAAFQPAWESMNISPKAALSAEQDPSWHQSSDKLALAGIGFILLVFPVSNIPGPQGFPLPGYTAGFFLFSGFAMISPWILQQIGKRIAEKLRNIGGEPAYLAARYISGSGPRTAVSAGSLITAVALFSALVIMIFSFRQTVELWIDQTVSGDLFLRSKMAEINQYQDPLPPDTVEKLKHITDAVDLLPYRSVYLNDEKTPCRFISADLNIFFRYGDLIMLEGDSEQTRDSLISGKGVAVSQVFSSRTGLGTGDIFQTEIKGLKLKLPILGVFRDYSTQGGVVYYSLQALQQDLNETYWTGVRIFFRDRTQATDANLSALHNKIREIAGDSLEIISGKKLKQTILNIFDETFAITSVLLVIALTVAALGITTTLTVLVLERSQHLNTLFAIGAGIGQIRAMIVWEALIMVITGEIAGLVCGFMLSYLLIFVINYKSFGWTFIYQADWETLAVSFPLIFIIALLSALPALKAVFREPPASLLRESL